MSTLETAATTDLIRTFGELSRDDVAYAGGKGANLGELTGAGVPVPLGFVVGAPAYGAFADATGLRARLTERLDHVDVDDTAALAAAAAEARALVLSDPMPEPLERAIRDAYAELSEDESAPVAVRSSATGEDTEWASFAGMNDTFLNVSGADAVIDAVRRCWASLFGSRTVFYRAKRGFPRVGVDIAVVVQRQIQSTRAGVMFTIDPASGRHDRIVIEGAFGLGESVASGQVSPDRYLLDKETLTIVTRDVKRKELAIDSVAGGGTQARELEPDEALYPVLTDKEVHRLGAIALQIESHYSSPQHTEWAFDRSGRIWMLQSRPVTSAGGTSATGGEPVLRGLGAAPGQANGTVRMVKTLTDGAAFAEGEVLVAHMSAPDLVPLMRRAAAIVTDSGGMTCHAAIVSRELGVPCVAGTGDATDKLRDGEVVTVDSTHGVVVLGAGIATEPSQVEHAAAPEAARR